MKAIRIHPDDNVAVILEDIRQGEALELNGIAVTAAEDIARGHKIALRRIAEGEPVGARPQRPHRPERVGGLHLLP